MAEPLPVRGGAGVQSSTTNMVNVGRDPGLIRIEHDSEDEDNYSNRQAATANGNYTSSQGNIAGVHPQKINFNNNLMMKR